MITDKMVEAARSALMACGCAYRAPTDGELRFALKAAEDAMEHTQHAPFDAEALIAAAVPSGSVCDPQRVADAIRAWFGSATTKDSSGDAPGWSGWAVQYPGEMPKLYGAREIAELNFYPEEGARLIHLMEAAPRSGDAPVAWGWAYKTRPESDMAAVTETSARMGERDDSNPFWVPVYPLYATPVSAPAGKIAAWHTDDGRTISAKQKSDAERSGGASASSVAAYSIPSYFGCAPADARDTGQRIQDEHDARRYRWLRSCDIDQDRSVHGPDYTELLDGERLDAAIDRAMGAQQGN